jgi:hypothetical protein
MDLAVETIPIANLKYFWCCEMSQSFLITLPVDALASSQRAVTAAAATYATVCGRRHHVVVFRLGAKCRCHHVVVAIVR